MIKSELYQGKIYAGDTPLECSIAVDQTGPLQLTIRAGHLQTTGQARIVPKNQLRQSEIDELLTKGDAEQMPPIKARKIPVSDLSQQELADFERMGKLVRQSFAVVTASEKQLVAGDTIIVREDDLVEEKRSLGSPVDLDDERLRVWVPGQEKKKRHEMNTDFVWNVEVPLDSIFAYWLIVATDPSGESRFLINKVDLTEFTPGKDIKYPPGWTDIQTLVLPFTVEAASMELPDIYVLTVLSGFPPAETDPLSAAVTV